jgi:hypothetical protein
MSIEPSQTAIQVPQDPPASLQTAASKDRKDPAKGSAFGPAYVLDPSLRSTVPQVSGTVPFVVSTPGQTLASLPPLKPMGSASLTQLSLQHLLEPTGGNTDAGQ